EPAQTVLRLAWPSPERCCAPGVTPEAAGECPDGAAGFRKAQGECDLRPRSRMPLIDPRGASNDRPRSRPRPAVLAEPQDRILARDRRVRFYRSSDQITGFASMGRFSGAPRVPGRQVSQARWALRANSMAEMCGVANTSTVNPQDSGHHSGP